ncbi:HNH endonuclease [Mycobacterium phage Dandelion]|uniref:Uncharacterized protein n=1 Tax=Mycobacterium phage Dandelion TaxID=1074305 RepID=G1JW98_9CAUD|nr:HNH endonuclease [Mycobacterium phage Dandelion]AEL97816.1 hypothetical protein DANDELION_151 [Mycobacterium phage Dandelion]
MTCKSCGSEKRVQDSNVGKYCSRACQSADVERVTFDCVGCGATVTMPKSQHRGRQYCSKACRADHKLQSRTHTCAGCGDSFVSAARGKAGRSVRFCSRQCRMKVLGSPSRVDGRSSHPHYNRWQNMVARCTQPHHQMWPDYGGRGITVCDEWLDPFAFYRYLDEVLGPMPDKCSLDRIDNNRGYEPGNIRWATAIEQFRNRRPFMVDPSGNKKRMVATGSRRRT